MNTTVTRILPAVGDAEAARPLVTLLGQLPDAEPLTPAVDSGQLLDTLDRLAAESVGDLPEVVLVHELIGPLPALELLREVALRFPSVGVVLVTRDTTPGLYSAAMDSGARGVVGIPVSYDELAARVGAAATWAAGVRRHLGQRTAGPGEAPGHGGTVLTVSGAKGGVGCTLAAVQIALAAQASGQRVALVDLDLQSGDVASFLDVQFRRSVADLAGIADLSPRVLQDVVYTHDTGLSLLLAPGDGERGEEVDDRTARQLVSALRSRYEVVVADCGTQMHAANAAAVEMADRALLVTTPDVVSVRAAKRVVRLWERLQIRKAEETVTAVNRASRHSEIQPPLVARVIGTPVARATVPAAFKELHTALDAGRIQDLDHRSTVKQALWTLAAELGAAGPPPQGGKGGARSHRAPKGGRTSGRTRNGAGGADAVEAAPSHGPQALAGGRRAALPPGGGVSGASGGSGASGAFGPDRGAVRLPWGRRLRDDRGAVRVPHRAVPVRFRGRNETPGGSADGTGGARDRGALTVEFAGLAPVVLVVLALLWQCVLIGHTFTLAGNAADEGARAAASAAAYGDPAAACRTAAREHLPAAWASGATVNCYSAGGLWKADVDLATPVLFPGAAHLPFTVNGTAGAAEEVE
ncbi:P-loop NTPase [Streptomyces sp. JJ36]|uniref:AAA family ATPase n=1 Tax=Streptomyces sp. JJ36 TaxID=2736645 RepID=UPI001F3B7BDA|nr:P-loop NTPase [Streptomyces sp. JJ36]MCF6522030.1 AAA family ATPase [Streptomyces sp. JJ36]